jgi:HEAT repeat protein
MSRDRWRELAVAGHAGDEVAARAALDDMDPVARELALGALHRMECLDETTLRTALRDSDPAVRRRAALIAGTRPGFSLQAALNDGDNGVVEAAAWACGEQEVVDDEVFATLLSLAGGSADALVREAAVAALGAIGDERGLPAILAACADKPAVRRRAALALAPFDGPEVDAALQAALEDRDWQVRQAAEDVLRASGE